MNFPYRTFRYLMVFFSYSLPIIACIPSTVVLENPPVCGENSKQSPLTPLPIQSTLSSWPPLSPITDVREYVLESPSICSGSIYFTPDGSCSTELSECYQSTENLPLSEHNKTHTNTTITISDVPYELRRRTIPHWSRNRDRLSKLCVVPQQSVSIEPITIDIFAEEVRHPAAVDNMADFRSTALTASTQANSDKGFFNVARHKKVELQNLSPKVSDINGKYEAFAYMQIQISKSNMSVILEYERLIAITRHYF